MSATLISLAPAPALHHAINAALRLLDAYHSPALAHRAALDAARLDQRGAAHWCLVAAVCVWEA